MPPAYLTAPYVTPRGVAMAHGCVGKERFESALDGQKAVARKAASAKNRMPLITSRCRVCGFYHLASALSRANKPGLQARILVVREPLR